MILFLSKYTKELIAECARLKVENIILAELHIAGVKKAKVDYRKEILQESVYKEDDCIGSSCLRIETREEFNKRKEQTLDRFRLESHSYYTLIESLTRIIDTIKNPQ